MRGWAYFGLLYVLNFKKMTFIDAALQLRNFIFQHESHLGKRKISINTLEFDDNVPRFMAVNPNEIVAIFGNEENVGRSVSETAQNLMLKKQGKLARDCPAIDKIGSGLSLSEFN